MIDVDDLERSGAKYSEALEAGILRLRPTRHRTLKLPLLTPNRYANLLRPGAYSCQYPGQSATLDHEPVSPSLLPQITDVAEWQIKADEPPVFDYNLDFGRDSTMFDAASPYRALDHDPIVIGLDLTATR